MTEHPVSSGHSQLTFNPKTDLTDVALYSYSGLFAYTLGKLFEGSPHDKELIEKWVAKIIEHNGQGSTSKETMQALANAEVQLDSADPFVDSLMSDPYIAQNSPKPIIQDLLRMAIEDGCYDSRVRTAVKYFCLLLKVNWFEIEVYESAIVENLQEEEHTPTEEEIKEQHSKDKTRKLKRYAMIGAAAIGGGALMGLTGGLAAPFIAAGAGAIIGGAGATALASTAGIAIIGSLFGVAGLGLGGYKMQKRVGNIEEFEFEPLTEGRQLHLTIAVSGWLTETMPEFKNAWLGLANSKEQYVLKYESKYLLQMGKALDYLVSIAINAATQEALKYTILSGILTAIAWPATLLAASSVIDNPWNVCTHRCVNVGRQLAEVLLFRQQGKRPVTLIGFSLGARVIFYCLQEMAKRKNCEGIIEDVILLGAPVTGNVKEWEPLARVVAGKVVNGYCRGDWLLKFLYRTASIQMSVAGLKAVPWENRRMHNIDLSDVVQGHMDYMYKVDEILEVVGIRTREHAARHAPNSLKAWVQIQKSSSGQNLKPLQNYDVTSTTVNSRDVQEATPSPSQSDNSADLQHASVTSTSGYRFGKPPEVQIEKSKNHKQEPNRENREQETGEFSGPLTQNMCPLSESSSHEKADKYGLCDQPVLAPPIQSNNIARQLEVMALSEADNVSSFETNQSRMNNISCSDSESMLAEGDMTGGLSELPSNSSDTLESGQHLDLLDVVTGNDHSKVSSHVTTPDSGISCDD